MGKKIWLSVYPRNVGSEQNRPYVRTSTPSSKPGWNSHLKYYTRGILAVNRMATQKEKTTAASISLFD